MLWLALGLVSLASTAGPLAVRKGPLPLPAAVDQSTFVCIGTVERVERLTLPARWDAPSTAERDQLDASGPTDAPFGRIRVERVLKGDPATKVAYHEAWSTWTCDDTTAHEGERCLFFLLPGNVSRARAEVREAVARAFDGAPVYSNVNSGDGIVPIQTREGDECVRFFGAPLEFQAEGVKYHQRLAPMLDYIETLARFAPDRAVIHATSRRDKPPQWKAFDFRILEDGSVRLSTGSGEGESVRVSMLGDPAWDVLRNSIATTLGPETISLGTPDSYNPYRSLRIRLPTARLSFVDDDSVIVSGMADAELATYRRVIRTWAVVREAVDCLDCVDHRSADKGWLER